MILYHGSNTNITEIDLQKSKPNKDFGRGFYLSDTEEQAQRLGAFKVVLDGGQVVVNKFEFDESILNSKELKVKIFKEYSEEWAEFIFANRNNKTIKPTHDYDIVYGPIANDKVGLQISNFENKIISLQELLERLKYMKGITFQYYFGTERAIQKLKKI
ncbi:MAG: DUF3990 domain-containing protein [Bacteroidales bacterium]|nr:DUF3990 domain-containing protein [Bacteroidales bacterium]